MTAQEVRSAVYETTRGDRAFELTATVTFTRREDDHLLLAVSDATGGVDLNLYGTPDIAPTNGMKISVSGRTRGTGPGRQAVVVLPFSVLACGPAPASVEASGDELVGGRIDCRLARITGFVRDIARSELNANWTFLVLNCQGKKVYVSVPTRGPPPECLTSLVDRKVSAVGICLPFDCTSRARMGRVFKVSAIEDIRPIDGPPTSPSVLPDVGSIAHLAPEDVAVLGRHRASGLVIAAWGGCKALLRTDVGNLVQLEFAGGGLPVHGVRVEAVGLPDFRGSPQWWYAKTSLAALIR